MIKDNIKNAKKYYDSISENIKIGLEWILSSDLIAAECKKYFIRNEKIYANIQEYETKDDAKYEAHRKYIDIQYIIKGSEKIGITDIKNCKNVIDYNEEKDIEFLDTQLDEKYEEMSEGDFLILYPNDAHKPSITNNRKASVKKVVVKVLAD